MAGKYHSVCAFVSRLQLQLSLLYRTEPQAAKEAARDPSMVGDGVARLLKSRYDSISTYLHYCKRREENPMHVLEVIRVVAGLL